MEIVNFNGLEQPLDDKTASGDILLLISDGTVSVVRLAILPPDDFGPELTPATNNPDLAAEALALVKREVPTLLEDGDGYTLSCPPSLAAKARFQE